MGFIYTYDIYTRLRFLIFIAFSIGINSHYTRSLLEPWVHSLACVIQKCAPVNLAHLIVYPRGNAQRGKSLGINIQEMQSRHTLDTSYKFTSRGLKL